MPVIPMLPKPGIVRGATPSTSMGSWFDANLMRWRGGQAQPVGGNMSFADVLFDTPGRDVLTWHDKAYKRWAAIGSGAKLWIYDFAVGTLTDITPAGIGPLELPGAFDGYGLGDYGLETYGTPRPADMIGPAEVSAVLGDWWSLDTFGQDLLVVPTQDGRLFRWSPTTPDAPAALVPNAPVNNKGVVVTDERHVVLIGANGDPRMVAWSDQEKPDVWTAAVGNLAGDKMLVTDGRPMQAIKVTGGVLILTDNDAHLMRYVGSPYGYGINQIGSNCGAISPRAASSAGSAVWWMGVQGFWSFTGTVQPVECNVEDWLFSLLNRSQIGRVFGAPNAAFTEHWWYWPSEDSVECNRYVAVNYAERGQPWMIGTMRRTAADKRASMIRPILAGEDAKLYLHEYGWTDDGQTRLGKVYLETGDLTMEQWGGDAGRRFHIRQIAADYAGPADAMAFRVFSWEEPDGQVLDSGTLLPDPSDGVTDAEVSGRGMRVRIEGLADKPFALGLTRLLTRPGGRQ